MKLIQALICITTIAACFSAMADEPRASENKDKVVSTSKQPEVGYVAVSRALVYSGPSEDYYPTHQLQQGTSIQIYHSTDSGWLAIRPPAGSFSWIPATDGYLLPGGKSVEITAKNSVSWIGSSLGTAKQYRWQVQLNVGEQLTKLGEETIKDKEGKETLWYKIAPPNGEFRWIQSGSISRQPPEWIAQPNQVAESKVVPASGEKKTAAKSNVKPAGLLRKQEQVEGVPIESGSRQGEIIIDDGTMSSAMVEGEVVYDGEVESGEYIVSEGEEPEYDANWNDWQLFEFTDQGLRLPFLERAAAWRNTQPDTLAADPFSLDMAPKKKGHQRPGLPDPTPVVPNRRRTPWRDPRELSDQRMMGYPQSSGERGLGTTMSALRGTLDDTRDTFRNNFGGSTILDSSNSSRHYESTPSGSGASGAGASGSGAPKTAPPLESSTFSNRFSGRGSVDMPNLPTEPLASNSGSSWSNRNWFGLSNRSGDTGDRSGLGVQPMLEASGNAVTQLQQRLSEMVTRPMQHWNFGELKERVQYYINNGSSPTERGQARLLMERIGEFERHAMRSGQSLSSVQGSGGAYSGPAVSLASASATVGSSAGGSSTGGPLGSGVSSTGFTSAGYTVPATNAGGDTMASRNFDATGWLVPLHAAQPGQPTHVLHSDSGLVIAYVTAIPGLKLDSFVNEPVGIQGLRGYLQEFRAAHIELQNITRLR
ncbi:MAG: hypothetical protein U0930_19160 [Pirellulales bacterium]